MNKKIVILSEMLPADIEIHIKSLQDFLENHEFSVYTYNKLDPKINIQTDEDLNDKIINSRIVIFWDIRSIDYYEDFITTISENPDIRIIATSNHPTINEAYQSLILGMKDYIPLPTYTGLLKKVEELVIY